MKRRDFLRTSVGMAAVGTLATAGCSEIPVVGPGGDEGAGSYTNWMPAPDTISDLGDYNVHVTKTGTVFANEDVFDEREVRGLASERDELLNRIEVDTEDVRQMIKTGGGEVFFGDFATGEVAEILSSGRYSEAGETDDATLYLDDRSTHAWAVSSDVLVFEISMNPLDNIRNLFATKRGEVERYVDVSETMAALTDSLGDGFSLHAQTTRKFTEARPEYWQLEDSVGLGRRKSLDGSTVNVRIVFAYEDASEVHGDDLEDFVDATDLDSDLDDVTYDTSGRTGVVSGQKPAGDVDL